MERVKKSYLGLHLAYFTLLILLGGLTLHYNEGSSRPFLLSLFTAASAACQTGLVVIDTSVLQASSQVVLVILMLLGGTVLLSSVPVLIRLSYLQRMVTRGEASAGATAAEGAALVCLVRVILVYWALGLGLPFLFYGLYATHWPAMAALLASRGVHPWQFAALLSVSSFSNASFIPFTDNMVPCASHPSVLLVSALQVLLGNYAYPVALRAIVQALARQQQPGAPCSSPYAFLLAHPHRYCTHLFSAAVTTQIAAWLSILTLADFWLVLALDYRAPYLSAYSGPTRALLTFYQAVNTRAAGFNVYNISAVAPAGQVMYALSMYISSYRSVGETAGSMRQEAGGSAAGTRSSSEGGAQGRGEQGQLLQQLELGGQQQVEVEEGEEEEEEGSVDTLNFQSVASLKKQLRLRMPQSPLKPHSPLRLHSPLKAAGLVAVEEGDGEEEGHRAGACTVAAPPTAAPAGNASASASSSSSLSSALAAGGSLLRVLALHWGRAFTSLFLEDTFFIYFSLLLIALLDGPLLASAASPAYASLFGVLFELLSAIGNVGLTLSDTPVCLTALLSPASQLIVLLVMVRGRHRGVPYYIAKPKVAAGRAGSGGSGGSGGSELLPAAGGVGGGGDCPRTPARASARASVLVAR